MPKPEHSPSEFFSKHAEDYAKSESHARGSDLPTLIDKLRPASSEIALDVATGTGFTAVALAPRVKQVVATDLTEEMLDQAKKLAGERGIANIRFERADAADLPFADSSFDIVTIRRAAHHFQDVPAFLLEAKRVLRHGGRLGIVDMSPPEGSEEFFNRIERLRDLTHVRALTPKEWRQLVANAGLAITSEQLLPEQIPFERWLYPVAMGGREEALIRGEWGKATPNVRTLLEVKEHGGLVEGWTKVRIVLVANKARRQV
jgi:ubiquinone/menaquinone biosynthesis C-methylase UbiE